jgi:FG-GAP repeat
MASRRARFQIAREQISSTRLSAGPHTSPICVGVGNERCVWPLCGRQDREISVTTASVRRRIATSIFALALAQLAHAELPQRAATQVLEPVPGTDTRESPDEPPDPPYFGSGLAMQGNVALAGMPGAFAERGRVAVFVRDTAGRWVRRQTLTPSNPAVGADFGQHVAIFNRRALITSRSAVYVFQLQTGKWRETGKLSFGRTVQVHDLDWHWSTVVVGASDATGNAAYVFHMNADGTFVRISRLAPPDADAADRFGEHVAVYSATVAVTAPGYNEEEGAAYIFTCSETRCAERQKLLANDGAGGDGFGGALDLANGLLVVGAPSADWVPGDPSRPPSTKNHHAGGAAYLFVRSGGTWVEQQKFRPSAGELNWYSAFGYEVAISATHVVVGAPYGVDSFEAGYAVEYRWSGGSLVATHVMQGDASHGAVLALYNDALLLGAPDGPPYYGEASVYNLATP